MSPRLLTALLLALATALTWTSSAHGAMPDIQVTRTAVDTITVTAPKDFPLHLWVEHDDTRLILLTEGFATPMPTFTAASVPAGCDLDVFFGYGVACPMSGVRHVHVVMGDKDDLLDAIVGGVDNGQTRAWLLTIMVSAWNRCPDPRDMNNAAAPSLTLDGGDGDDKIVGSPGADELNGGPGHDILEPGGGADRVNGGPGFDEASFCDTPDPVSMTLDGQPNDGVAGQKARLGPDVEDLQGGAADDVLVGDAGPNHLEGGAGNDRLEGGPTGDLLDGGSGDDDLQARDAAIDLIRCGDGLADRATVDPGEQTIDCETLDQPPTLPSDADGDGYARPVDCDDGERSVHPDTLDTPDDGIDQNCDGGDAVELDRDHDGSPRPVDCNDQDREISPAAKELAGNDADEDCDGIAQPFARIATLIEDGFAASARTTRVTRLRLLAVQAGTTVELRCTGKGCPRARWQTVVSHTKTTMDLRDLASVGRARLRPGARLEVRISRAGTLGKLVTYRVRSRRIPAITSACLDPASGASRRCPS
jgi:hypothetical protein